MKIKNIKDNVLNYGNKVMQFAIVAAASSGVTYYVCQKDYEEKIGQMDKQVALLREKEHNAVVTQRISEQMEDIAYQQKEISDKQKERAEEQSRIADIERGKAEFERGMAQMAEHKAVRAAKEADSMRVVAERQTAIATSNMREAVEARAQADTLFYLSLSRSLAQASLRESAGGYSTDLSRLLSYASWHYARQYSKDVYQQELYQSLIRSSDLLRNNAGIVKGNVRFIKVVRIDGVKVTMAVTDYGEILFINPQDVALYQVPQFDIRDVAMSGSTFYALTSDGIIVRAKTDGALEGAGNVDIDDIAHLPADKWRHIMQTADGKQLVAIADNHIVWYDIEKTEPALIMPVSKRLTALGMADGVMHIFAADGVHYTTTVQGELKQSDMPFLKSDVTAFAYDRNNRQMYLGMKDGSIHITDNQCNEAYVLTGHTSEITHLIMHGDALMSGSYDKTLKFWRPNNIMNKIPPFEQKLDLWPLTFDVDRETHTMWIGTASGYLINFCVNMQVNADANRKLLKREFTDTEWNYFIGPLIPRINFMEEKEEAR